MSNARATDPLASWEGALGLSGEGATEEQRKQRVLDVLRGRLAQMDQQIQEAAREWIRNHG